MQCGGDRFEPGRVHLNYQSMFYTYVLKSLRNGRYYTGSTNNLVRRLGEHNSGLSKYTKFTRAFELIHKEEFKTRKEAIQRERFLKTGIGRKWIKSNLE